MADTDYIPSTIEAQAQGIVKPLDPQPNAYRLEIDEFVLNGPALNLFLLALEELQKNELLAKLKDEWRNMDRDSDAKQKWKRYLSDLEKYWWSYFAIAGTMSPAK